MATFGEMGDGFWGPFQVGGQKTFAVPMAAGETLFFVHFLVGEDLGWEDDWTASPPFSFPAGWENAIDADDPYASVQTRINANFNDRAMVAVPYVYRGEGVLTEVTVTTRSDGTAAMVVFFGVTLGEGEEVLDFLGAGGHAINTEGVDIDAAGNALASGKRFAVVSRELISGGIF